MPEAPSFVLLRLPLVLHENIKRDSCHMDLRWPERTCYVYSLPSILRPLAQLILMQVGVMMDT